MTKMPGKRRIDEIADRKPDTRGKKTRDRVGLYLHQGNYHAVKVWAEARGSKVSEVVDALLDDFIREQKILVASNRKSQK
jgi:hypothetical protein